jgi:hypothetical protein
MSEPDHSDEQSARSDVPRPKRLDLGLPPILNGRRLLPNHFGPGHVLTEDDMDRLRELLDSHYQWLAFYRKLKEETEHQLEDQFLYIRQLQSTLKAPVTGYVLQGQRSKGVYRDGWAAPILEVHIRPLKPVDKLLIRGWRPPEADTVRFDAFVNARQVLHASVGNREFEFAVDCQEPLRETFTLRLECGPVHLSPENSDTGDSRNLAFVLTEIRAEHYLSEGTSGGAGTNG